MTDAKIDKSPSLAAAVSKAGLKKVSGARARGRGSSSSSPSRSPTFCFKSTVFASLNALQMLLFYGVLVFLWRRPSSLSSSPGEDLSVGIRPRLRLDHLDQDHREAHGLGRRSRPRPPPRGGRHPRGRPDSRPRQRLAHRVPEGAASLPPSRCSASATASRSSSSTESWPWACPSSPPSSAPGACCT